MGSAGNSELQPYQLSFELTDTGFQLKLPYGLTAQVARAVVHGLHVSTRAMVSDTNPGQTQLQSRNRELSNEARKVLRMTYGPAMVRKIQECINEGVAHIKLEVRAEANLALVKYLDESLGL